MIKVTVGELVVANNTGALKKLFSSVELSADFRWENRKLFSEIRKELQEFETLELDIRKKHSEENEEGNSLVENKYWEEIQSVLEKEIEFDYDHLDSEELKKANMSIEEILSIEFLLE